MKIVSKRLRAALKEGEELPSDLKPSVESPNLSSAVQSAMDSGKLTWLSTDVLRPNPKNPRRETDGPGFAELLASVRAKGILEPLIVRPIAAVKETPGYWEVVAGGRRLEAAKRTGIVRLPVVVRDLTDEEAYDVMIVENLHREDLTPYERAFSFREFLERRAPTKGWEAQLDTMRELSARTGIPTSTIHRHIAVLRLPERLLKEWEAGRVTFGHLEQFLRITETKDLEALVKSFLQDKGDDRDSVSSLRRQIDSLEVKLGGALFDLRACQTCGHNSVVQGNLFGLVSKTTSCLNQACFKEKQGDWLAAHWKETPGGKRLRTNGTQFDVDYLYGSRNRYSQFEHREAPAEKCLECEHFLTLVGLDGKPNKSYYGGELCCFGDLKCKQAVERAAAAKRRSETRKEKSRAIAGAERRVSWHGEYFRQAFFRKRIAEALKGKPFDHLLPRLAVLAIVNRYQPAEYAAAEVLGIKPSVDMEEKIVDAVLALGDKDWGKVSELSVAVVTRVLVDGKVKSGGWDPGPFPGELRQKVAEWLGADIAKEWEMTEDWLRMKTMREILAWVKKSGLIKELAKKKPKTWAGDPQRIKKTTIVEDILHSGLKLRGLVPEEVAGAKRTKGGRR